MDRQAGPRHPDKRNAAYESIFGRPSVIHHQPARPQPQNGGPSSYASSSTSVQYLPPQHLHPQQTYHHPQYYPQYPPQQQPLQQLHPQQPLGYSSPQIDRRASSIFNSPYGQHPQQQHYPISQPFLPYQQPQQQHSQLAVQATHARTRSLISAPSAPGAITPPTPPYLEPPEPNYGGLTPAQAYQASVYMNSPPEAEPQPLLIPKLGTIDTDDGRLGIDFKDKVNIDSPVVIDSPDEKIPSGRRSTESARTLPPHFKREARTAQDRSMSMSAASMVAGKPHLTSPSMRRNSRPPMPLNSPSNPSRKATSPSVYPAMLSRVAQALQERVTLADRVKDGLTYKDAFDGKDAVEKIAGIIKTSDRDLALLLGRALDAQKFFHDVTYDHRLRDSPTEIYQFKTGISTTGIFVEAAENVDLTGSPSIMGAEDALSLDGSTLASAATTPALPTTPEEVGSIVNLSEADEIALPSGVFTLLTDCYSPTCSRDQLCYSIGCPRRLEQQNRLNMKPAPGKLQKSESRESLLADAGDGGTLWRHMVPAEVLNSISEQEQKRQEAINEVIYTERDFCRDMEYLRDVWIDRIKNGDSIQPPTRRTDFLDQVFWNIHDIIGISNRLRDALNRRQKAQLVVERLGDVFLDAAPHFMPFVTYGAHQLYGKYEFEKEKASNPAFAAFVDATERLPESRKLELNGYLTKPTTRLARYPLLLGAVLKHTSDDNPDHESLQQVIAIIRDFLNKVNVESGRTENKFNLLQLESQLSFRPGESVNLRLSDEGRELVYKGALNKRGGTTSDAGDLQVFLFDHALVMAKPKGKTETYKVYRRPIPLELLLVSAPEDPSGNSIARPGPKTVRRTTRSVDHGPNPPNIPFKIEGKGYPIHFVHLGRRFYQITLWASSYQAQRNWVDHICRQQEMMRERTTVCETSPISENFFMSPNRVNCAATFNGGRRVVYGTDDGVYLQDSREKNKHPVKVLALLECTQIDVLEDYQLLIVMSERQVITFPLDSFDPIDPASGLKRAKRISSHTTFFKAGVCMNKVLVCIVKSSPLSSTIRVFEPIDQNVRGRKKPTFRKILQGGNDTLAALRELYVPFESNSIHFLRTKLCVGSTKGFTIIDLESLDVQGLLDHSDASLDFMKRRDNARAMAIFRIGDEFLLCYDELAFYVNRKGWRSRKEFMVQWEGAPTGFAIHYPYVMAFEPTFVEIRHLETGYMAQIIQGNNLRLLFADSPLSAPQSTMANHHPPHHPYGHNPPYGNYSAMTSTQSFTRQGPYGNMGTNMYNTQNIGYGYGAPPAPPTPANAQAFSRDEIILSSDERVFLLRFQGAQISDSASFR